MYGGRVRAIMADIYALPTTLPPLNEIEVYHALEDTNGNISAVARQFGKPRHKVFQYIQANKNLMLLLEDLRNTVLDQAEQNFNKAVNEGDLIASRFMLETQGKDRGFTHRLENTGPGGGPIENELVIRFERPGDPDPIGGGDAIHQEGSQNHALHEENLRFKEGGAGLLRLPQQGQDQGRGEEGQEA